MEKRVLSLKIFLVVFLMLFLTGIVFAQNDTDGNETDNNETNGDGDTDGNNDNNETDGDDDNGDDRRGGELKKRIRMKRDEFKAEIDGLKIEFKGDIGALRDEAKDILKALEEGDLTREEKEEIRRQLRALRIEKGELRVEYRNEARNIRVEYRGEFKELMEEFREGHKHRTRDGREIEVKIMPSVASDTAIARLKLKVCNEDNGCTIEFKEVGQGENTEIRYELKAKKAGRFLGIFKVKMDVESEVDAESGEVVRVRKPWWAFLVNE